MTQTKREWIATEHHQALVDRVPDHKDRVVSYTDSDGIERAVWDNHCYMESFRYEGGVWVADTVDDAEKWTKEVTDAYGEACLELEDRAVAAG